MRCLGINNNYLKLKDKQVMIICLNGKNLIVVISDFEILILLELGIFSSLYLGWLEGIEPSIFRATT